MKIVKKPLSDLRPPERNVRKHTDKQITEYIRSLEKFGQIRPIVIDEENVVWIGNGLCEAMRRIGWTEAFCMVKRDMTANDKKKMMMADNRIYELGITDMDAFEELIKELDGDTDVPGWDEDLIAMMNAAVADVDEMVAGYGTFDAEDVGRLAERPAPAQGDTTPAPQHHDETSTPQDTVAEKADVQKVIICPKCGERICL